MSLTASETSKLQNIFKEITDKSTIDIDWSVFERFRQLLPIITFKVIHTFLTKIVFKIVADDLQIDTLFQLLIEEICRSHVNLKLSQSIVSVLKNLVKNYNDGLIGKQQMQHTMDEIMLFVTEYSEQRSSELNLDESDKYLFEYMKGKLVFNKQICL